MKRAPIVLTGTACGLVAVIGYHAATPQASALASSSSGGGSTLKIGGAGGASTKSAGTGSATSAHTGGTASAGSSSSASTSAASGLGPSGTRSATGSDIQYGYGQLAVTVTVSGSRITSVSLAQHQAYDPQSQMIDQYALPRLHSQAMQKQSARIDGVSGASYTSAAYAQSLQSALDKLKA